MAKIGANQVDLNTSHLEASGTNDRQVGIKAGAVDESKLGFSWETLDIAASEFTDAGSDLWTKTVTSASAQANVEEMAQLSRNGVVLEEKVTTPSANGEWKLSGTTLTVFWDGTLTSTEDDYQLRYITGTATDPFVASDVLVARVTQDSEQTIAYNTETAVIFHSEEVDTGGFWDAGSPTELTIPEDGFYAFGGFIRWDTGTSGPIMTMRIARNADTLVKTDTTRDSASTQAQSCAGMAWFSKDDVLKLWVYHLVVGGMNLKHWTDDESPAFWVAKLSHSYSTAFMPGHIEGFELSRNTTNPTYQLDIAAGSARSDDDTVNLVSTSVETIDIVVSGVGGRLSAAAEASDTLYAVWCIRKDSDGSLAYGFDVDFDSPTYPEGYSKGRRIGSWLNDASSNLFNFRQTGSSQTRRHDPTASSFWVTSDTSPCPSTPTTMQGPVNIERVVLFGHMAVNATDTAHHNVFLRNDTGSLLSLHVYTLSNSSQLMWTNRTDANGRLYYWAHGESPYSLNVSVWLFVNSYEDYL